MAGTIYSRDPRNPQEVYGPFPVDQLPEFVKQGRVRATDQVSFDEQTWMPATELEPKLFPPAAAPRDRLEGLPPWKQTALKVGGGLKAVAIVVWNYIKSTAEFYWSHRGELRQMAVETIPILKDPGARRELQLNADESNDVVLVRRQPVEGRTSRLLRCLRRTGRGRVEQGTAFDSPTSRGRFIFPCWGCSSVSRPGFLRGAATASGSCRWASFAGFLIGYQLRRDTVVTVQFRRCREHLNRTKIPSLRVFRKKLIVGIGDRKVWRLFYHGDRGLETPIAAPPDFREIVDAKRAEEDSQRSSPYPTTIPLVDDSELESNRDSSHPET